ncbi:hypothetical protein ACG2F4_09455 [Halalkalibaculum sp. DA3122]
MLILNQKSSTLFDNDTTLSQMPDGQDDDSGGQDSERNLPSPEDSDS